MKKKVIISLLISILVVILFIVGLYFYGLTGVSKKDDIVSFNIASGTSIKSVINDLYEAKIIKSKIATLIYVKLHSDLQVQAGTYELNRKDSTMEIFSKLKKGNALVDSVSITFVEGKRLTEYMRQIENTFGYTESEILSVLSDEEYLKELINKYEFIDDSILNKDIYYSLEGYLFPSTYEFYKDESIKGIFKKMLDKMQNVLDNYNTSIKESEFSYHEILTIASIIENETVYDEDRSVASEVIYKRLSINMSLGMDVTTYYGVQKPLTEVLTKSDINSVNAYNTRNTSFIGLPVGPISNPSEKAIKAALNPSDDDYLYFYADKGGKLHFASNYTEFQELIRIYS